MKKLATLSPGQIFNFAGEQFVVMEQRDGAAFVLLAQSKESCPFNDKDNAENRNDYTCSTLKERIDKWVEALPRTSEEAAAILPFEVDSPHNSILLLVLGILLRKHLTRQRQN